MKQESSPSLLDRTQELLKDTKKTLPSIYRDTGINFYWLRKFKSGKIKDPSVNTVQKLYEYLSGKNLLQG